MRDEVRNSPLRPRLKCESPALLARLLPVSTFEEVRRPGGGDRSLDNFIANCSSAGVLRSGERGNRSVEPSTFGCDVHAISSTCASPPGPPACWQLAFSLSFKVSPDPAEALLASTVSGRSSLKFLLDQVPPNSGASSASASASRAPNCGEWGGSGLPGAAADALVAPSAASGRERDSLLASTPPARPKDEERPKGRRDGESKHTSLDRDLLANELPELPIG